jgi:hypothetical protein
MNKLKRISLTLLVAASVSCASTIKSISTTASSAAATFTGQAIKDASLLACTTPPLPGCATPAQMSAVATTLAVLSQAGQTYNSAVLAANGNVPQSVAAFVALVQAFDIAVTQIQTTLGPNAAVVITDLQSALKAL